MPHEETKLIPVLSQCKKKDLDKMPFYSLLPSLCMQQYYCPQYCYIMHHSLQSFSGQSMQHFYHVLFFSCNHPSISLSEIMTPMELMIINLTLLIPIHTFAACFIVQNPLNHSKVTILVTNSPCTTSTIQHFCIVSHLPSCESALSGIRTHDLPIRRPSC